MSVRRTHRNPARAERGIALLTAIILVAIATVLATAISFASAMSARRASTVFGADQSMLVAEGAEAMAAYVLEQSGPNHVQDALNQPWAQSYGPFELLPGVTLEFLQLEDEQGKFNINDLAPGGASNSTSIAEFQQLLKLVGIQESKWGPLIADWIDSDDAPNFPDGAEDSVYLSQVPPYRTANLPLTSITELLALPGFGRDRFNLLAPYITALPPGQGINVCTASGHVLDAISGNTEYSTNEQQLQARRMQEGCFPTPAVFQASLHTPQQVKGAPSPQQLTNFYRLRTVITIGTARFSLYSLLQRDGAGQIHVILRTFGTE